MVPTSRGHPPDDSNIEVMFLDSVSHEDNAGQCFRGPDITVLVEHVLLAGVVNFTSKFGSKSDGSWTLKPITCRETICLTTIWIF